ncbi:transposase [Parapedobacter sp. SGR-10]|uniref:transposase n=1 Tax=Parapedobacter sp. SGR-10 TaxID=2710879 RepID=UPI001980082A|nr:transposase [Parapedobacter sp. SGR-10]
MSDKFQQKYRIPSARASWWDYSQEGTYFVTICTKNRIPYFGEIIDGVVKLSKIGEVVKNEWLKTAELRPDMDLFLDEWVIMPNHFHAIIVIGENPYNECNVETQCIASLRNDNKPINKFGPQSKNLGAIISWIQIYCF